ncbi:MAG: site-specific integrase, partial [Hungatella sp.]
QIRSDLMSEDMYIKFNYILGDIRAVLRYGIDDGALVRDVTANIKRLKYEPKPKRALTNEERQLIENAELTDKERAFVSLLLYTGTRRNECLALTREDIDLEKRTIRINKTLVPSNKAVDAVQSMTKTEAGNRILPISAPLLPILEEYCKDFRGHLFLTPSGCYYRTNLFQRFWRGILSKIKAANDNRPIADDITPHIFRHTYASDLYKAGYDIKAAQYLLGHTDIATTLDTYTHFGFMDIEISRMETYYETVKKQSVNNIISFKHA